ncbi:hypothetical protein NQZ68_007593 [Dissostichus eleginoides]|nr:hypothetical protein NQZ68_007593 [Dissostichus eleginoides]
MEERKETTSVINPPAVQHQLGKGQKSRGNGLYAIAKDTFNYEFSEKQQQPSSDSTPVITSCRLPDAQVGRRIDPASAGEKLEFVPHDEDLQRAATSFPESVSSKVAVRLQKLFTADSVDAFVG